MTETILKAAVLLFSFSSENMWDHTPEHSAAETALSSSDSGPPKVWIVTRLLYMSLFL